MDPDNAGAHCGLAICLSTTGDDEGALRHFKLAAGLEPSHAGHQKNLGRALASADRYGEAVRCYERAMEIGPEDGESLILLGVLYDELGEPDKAEASFQSATQVAPDDAEAHENLGRHVASTGDHARAVPILKRAIEIEESARDVMSFLEPHWQTFRSGLTRKTASKGPRNWHRTPHGSWSTPASAKRTKGGAPMPCGH